MSKLKLMALAAITAGVILPSFADRTLNDGLVAYLPFDDGTATNVVAGSPVTPEPSTGTAPTFVNNGMVGKCLNIPSGAYVKLTGSDSVTLAENSLGFKDSNKSFTAIIWANYGKQTKDPLLFANKGWSPGTLKGVLLCAQGDTANAQFNAAAGAAANRFDKYFTGEGSGKWTFYAMVCKSGSFTLYQGKSDGTLSSQTASSSGFDMNTGCPFYLAQDGTGNYSNGARPFIGKLDDFALWNRALSADDITRIYEFGRSGAGLGELLKIDANDAPTMEVAKSGDDQYTFTFGGRRTVTHALYIAAATDDEGEDKYAWDSFVKIDDIPVATNTYTYTVPLSYFEANQRIRFFLMQTGGLPYAKEVEYAHSDGNAYFNSGIAPRRELITEFDTRLTADNGTYQNFFGAFSVNGNKLSNYGMCRFYNPGNANHNKWDREYNTSKGLAHQFVGSCVLNTDYHVVFSTTNLVVDGTAYGSGLVLSDFVEGGYGIAVYRNEKEGAKYDQTMAGYFKNFSLYTPEHKVRDYVPVEDSEGTVGMFDRVTGQFVSSAGTALTAGADQDAARYGWVRCVSEPYLASSTTPATAAYIGGGTNPLDLADGANWACTNVFGFALPPDSVPTADTDVIVAGSTAFAVANGSVFACKSIKFDNATFVDGADMRGLDITKVTADSTIDLQGRTLRLSGANGAAAAFAMTDSSSGAPGTVLWDVAQGDILESAVTLAGNIRLIKDGAGVLSVGSASQTYTGGTDVSNGTIRVGSSGTGHFGSGVVYVPTGATYDACGGNESAVNLVLAGGKIANTGGNADLPSTLTMTADSTLEFAALPANHDMAIPVGAVWNLGGYTLSVLMDGYDPDLQTRDVTISNGTITATVNTYNGNTKGYVQIYKLRGREGLNLDLGNTCLRLTMDGVATSQVCDFTANARNEQGAVYSYSTSRLQIYGTFTPQNVRGLNMTMMDGSTLNLARLTGAFNCAFTNPKYNNSTPMNCNLNFSTTDENENGKVDVKVALGDRTKEELQAVIDGDGLIVKWSSEPAANVEFSLDDATFERGYRIKRVTGGLRLMKNSGLVIIVK